MTGLILVNLDALAQVAANGLTYKRKLAIGQAEVVGGPVVLPRGVHSRQVRILPVIGAGLEGALEVAGATALVVVGTDPQEVKAAQGRHVADLRPPANSVRACASLLGRESVVRLRDLVLAAREVSPHGAVGGLGLLAAVRAEVGQQEALATRAEVAVVQARAKLRPVETRLGPRYGP